MKSHTLKLFVGLVAFFCFFSSSVVLADDLLEKTQQAGYEVPENDLPEAAIVFEATHGQILYENNAEQIIDATDLSNLMTIYLVLEAIQNGTLSMDTPIVATANHEAISNLNMKNKPIYAGVEYTIKDLIQLALISSANAASVMLSNALEEQDGAFVVKMNEKAEELGMTNTTFNTATGLPAVQFEGYYQPEGFDIYTGNQTNVTDLAILTYHLLDTFPDILDLSKQTAFTILPDSLYQVEIFTDNESLSGQDFAQKGVDGLKTGTSPDSGFSYISTARQNGLRIVTILTGVGDAWNIESKSSLFKISNTLTQEIYNTYEYKDLLEAGEQVLNDEEIIVEKDLYGVLKINEEPSFVASDGLVEWMNHLPLISEDLAETTVAYQAAAEEVPVELERYTFLAFLIETVEITKLTIVALGMLLLSPILLLMSLFIPRKITDTADDFEHLEMEEEAFSRSDKHQKKTTSRVPYKSIVAWTGVCLLLAGAGILIIQYLL